MKLNTSCQQHSIAVTQSGFTLIEVLVTVIILAIGVLGVASLQISTYGQLRTSHNLSTAALLAGEMADRMTANAAQALANSYNHTTVPGGTPTNCATNPCSAAELAAYDVDVWQKRVTGNIASGPLTPGALPGGKGSVSREAGTNNFNIVVQWDDDLSGSTDRTCDPNDPDTLDCYTITVSY